MAAVIRDVTETRRTEQRLRTVRERIEPEATTEPLDVNDIVGRVATILERTVAQQVKVRLGLAALPQVTTADRHLLQQIVLNLVINERDVPSGRRLTMTTAPPADGGLPRGDERSSSRVFLPVVCGPVVCGHVVIGGPPGGQLTEREGEVLIGIARGCTNKAIAAELFLSVNTVRNYVQSVLTKLGAHSKLEAVSIAVRDGIIHFPPTR